MPIKRIPKQGTSALTARASQFGVAFSFAIAPIIVSFQWMPVRPAFAQAPSDAAAELKDTRNAAQQLEALSEQLDMQALRDFFEYDPRGRRDPFTIPEVDKPADQLPNHGPLLPLQRFDLSALKLIGIIWDVNRPRAMIQEADSKRIHTVGVNAKIGIRNGYIAVIREGEVVVVETVEQDGRLISTAQIMKLVR